MLYRQTCVLIFFFFSLFVFIHKSNTSKQRNNPPWKRERLTPSQASSLVVFHPHQDNHLTVSETTIISLIRCLHYSVVSEKSVLHTHVTTDVTSFHLVNEIVSFDCLMFQLLLVSHLFIFYLIKEN